jgi:hypothetical protein
LLILVFWIATPSSGHMFLRISGIYSEVHAELQSTRPTWQPSYFPLWGHEISLYFFSALSTSSVIRHKIIYALFKRLAVLLFSSEFRRSWTFQTK